MTASTLRNESNRMLPMNSMVFGSNVALLAPFNNGQSDASMVNLHEAADENVTAVPKYIDIVPYKEPKWKKILKAVKNALSFKKRIKIGRPSGFYHVKNGTVADFHAIMDAMADKHADSPTKNHRVNESEDTNVVADLDPKNRRVTFLEGTNTDPAIGVTK